jgi:hypothetical protein
MGTAVWKQYSPPSRSCTSILGGALPACSVVAGSMRRVRDRPFVRRPARRPRRQAPEADPRWGEQQCEDALSLVVLSERQTSELGNACLIGRGRRAPTRSAARGQRRRRASARPAARIRTPTPSGKDSMVLSAIPLASAPDAESDPPSRRAGRLRARRSGADVEAHPQLDAGGVALADGELVAALGDRAEADTQAGRSTRT